MKLTIGQKVLLGYSVALLFMAGIGIAAYRSTALLMENTSMVTHTHIVLGEAETILGMLVDAESSYRGFLLTGDASFLEPFENASKAIFGNQKSLKDLTADNPSQQRRLDALDTLLQRKMNLGREVINIRKEKGMLPAIRMIQDNKGRELTAEIRSTIAALEEEERNLLSHRDQKAEDSGRNTTMVILYGSIFGFLAVISLGIVIHKSIMRPLEEFQKFVTAVGEGDLTQKSAMEGNDEIGKLARNLNRMVGGLKDVAMQTRAAVEDLTSATAEILASAKQQAAGTGEQATACHQTTTTMQEVSQSCLQIAERAKQVASAAEIAAVASSSGAEAVEKTNQTVEIIREHSEAVADNIVALSEKTRMAGDIIATVNDIAEQSHLLALNAAIEAAAAGDHGRSFSVVAGEMKNLADQSKEATVQVKSILGDIQKGINTSVMLTEEAVKRVDVGKKQSDVAASAIRGMTASITESVQAFQQIVAGTNQQQIGFEHVMQAVKDISRASEQTASSTRQMEKAAANLTALSHQLRKMMDRYKV